MLARERRRCACSLAVRALSAIAAAASQADAQNATAAGVTEAADVETVVVNGIRQSLATSQAIKKNADQIVDSAIDVDIGALPDRNVAEALQRIPGVTLERADPSAEVVAYPGTGKSVQIRGLTWVENEINGREVFSAVDGRALSLSDFSADLLSGIDVYKNPDATMIEGGVGGTIDLRTRKPLEQDGQIIMASGDFTYAELGRRGTFSGNALFSDRRSTGIGQIGALVSVDYSDQRYRNQGIAHPPADCVDRSGALSIGSAECNALPVGQKVFIPFGMDWYHIDFKEQRAALDAVVQWRPNTAWDVTLEGLYSKTDERVVEHSLGSLLNQAGLGAFGSDSQFAPDGRWLSGQQRPDVIATIVAPAKHHNTTGDYSLNVHFHPEGSWSFSADAQFVQSTAQYTRPFNRTWVGLPAPLNYVNMTGLDAAMTFDLRGSVPVITEQEFDDGTGLSDKSNYLWAAEADQLEDNIAHGWAWRADVHYAAAAGWSVDAGFRGNQKQAVSRQTGWNYARISPDFGQFDIPATTLDLAGCPLNLATGQPCTSNPSLLNASEFYDWGTILGHPTGKAWVAKVSLLDQGSAHAYDVLKSAEAFPPTSEGGESWIPYATQAGCTSQQGDVKCLKVYGIQELPSIAAGINDQIETVWSGYAQVNFAHDVFWPIDGNLGVRIVATEDRQNAGRALVPSGIDPAACLATQRGYIDAGLAPPACADVIAAAQFSDGGNQTTASTSRSDTRVLPSFNIRAHLTDQMQWRFALSKTIVRPPFKDLRDFTQLSFGFGPNNDSAFTDARQNLSGTFATNGTAMTGAGGNPHLKPMRAAQFDTSIEWYFAPAGSLTVALFSKGLSDYFRTASNLETYSSGGLTYTFGVTRPVNGAHGTVRGFEFAYQQFYDFLPGALAGLGFQGNYTYVDSAGGGNSANDVVNPGDVANANLSLPIEGLSRHSFNLALLYEKFSVSGRLGYNWRSRYLVASSSADFHVPLWTQAYGQLDASLFYSFLDHYTAGIEATNLLHERTFLEDGTPGFRTVDTWLETDRRVSLTLRARW
jgi:TonB-dependent receptor